MPSLKVELDMSGWDAIEKDMRFLESKQIEYGYPNPEDTHPAAGVPVGTVAYWNDVGTKTSEGQWKIPPRPFLSYNTAILSQFKMLELNKRIMWEIGEGSNSIMKGLNYAGKELTDLIEESIMTGNFTALAPSTIAGKQSDTILVDTTYMIDHADYKIGGA